MKKLDQDQVLMLQFSLQVLDDILSYDQPIPEEIYDHFWDFETGFDLHSYKEFKGSIKNLRLLLLEDL
jgi:hypothetical protein